MKAFIYFIAWVLFPSAWYSTMLYKDIISMILNDNKGGRVHSINYQLFNNISLNYSFKYGNIHILMSLMNNTITIFNNDKEVNLKNIDSINYMDLEDIIHHYNKSDFTFQTSDEKGITKNISKMCTMSHGMRSSRKKCFLNYNCIINELRDITITDKLDRVLFIINRSHIITETNVSSDTIESILVSICKEL